MKARRWILGVMILNLAFAGTALAEATVLRLPVYRSEGQLWLDQDMQLRGFRLEVLEALNRLLEPQDIRLEYKIDENAPLPIKRAINDILEGKYEAYFGLIYSRVREKAGLRYSRNAIYSIPTVVWMNRANRFAYTGLASLAGKTVGIVEGYPYLQDIRDPEFVIDSAPNDETNVKKLVRGRVDAIIDNVVRTGNVIVRLGAADDITYADRPFQITRFQIAYNPDVPADVIRRIDDAIARLHASGAIADVLQTNIYNPLKK